MKTFTIVFTLMITSSLLIAAPITLEGMGQVNQWTDFENQTGELPLDVWGTSDVDQADRVGIHVRFENGLEGSATYSGVSQLWNSIFSGIDADTATGFFTSANGLHFLFNNGSTLPMAWESFVMPFSNNFDLDYRNQSGSHFRANTAGWGSAVFTTYSSTAAVQTVPEPSTYIAFLFGLTLLGFTTRKKNKRNSK